MNSRILIVASSLAVLLVAAAVFVWAIAQFDTPKVSEEKVQNAIMTAVQHEAPASFYVTGYVDVTATSRMKTSRILLPGMLDWETSAVEATARVPGRVYYGFDVRNFTASDISVDSENNIRVNIPEIVVHATEPDLARLDVQTEHGWVRMHSLERERRTERQAIQRIQEALRHQGDVHLSGTDQAKLNSAEALEKILRPVLKSIGVDNPTFEFNIDDRLVMHSS